MNGKDVPSAAQNTWTRAEWEAVMGAMHTTAPSTSLARDPLPLAGRSALVTGVSRRSGIGFAVACRLAAYGASVACHHFGPHDAEQPWGADSIDAVLAGVAAHAAPGARIEGIFADLADPDAPERVVREAAAAVGPLSVLVCNQALSGSDGLLAEVGAEELDRHWAVNARASILLARAFAGSGRRGADSDAGRAITFLTSGQIEGPMPHEVAYVASKAALAGLTPTLADQLADQGIRLNTVNPGPVDSSSYMTDALKAELLPRFPLGRIGQPDDPARLIAWLSTDEAAWVSGQVISTEGGFRR